MRILVVNWQDRLNPLAGGAEIHLHEVFGRLAAWGHSVTLLCSGFHGAPSQAEVDGIQVHRVGRRMSFPMSVPRAVRDLQIRGPFDVAVEDLNKIPVFLPFWADSPVVLLVHHLFGATAFKEASVPVAALTWLMERPIPRVYGDIPTVAVSRSTAQDLGGRGLPEGDILIVPNGVDLVRLSPDPDGEEDPGPSILYLGRLKRYKGVDLILRALARLREQGLPIRMRIAGKGDHEARLRELTRDLGLEASVEFLGFVDEDTKVRLLRRSWVHVLASPKEGWGISILEAAACGTPTVASDSPGLRDAVRHGDTGLLVPHGDVQALAGAVGALVEDSEARRTMGQRARRFAETFTWESSARVMENVLGNQVAGARPGK